MILSFILFSNRKSGSAQSNASIVGYLGFVAVMFREFLNRAENDKDFDKLLHETPRFDEYVTEILKPEEKKEQTNLGVDEHSESGQVDDFDYTRSESEDDNDSDDEEFNDRNSDSMINVFIHFLSFFFLSACLRGISTEWFTDDYGIAILSDHSQSLNSLFVISLNK